MSTPISHSLSPNIGLETVLTTQELEPPQLPQLTSLPPSEETMEAQLPLLLGSPTIDARILAALRPFLRNRDILGPNRWGTLADEAPASLEEIAAGMPEGDDKQALLAAARLLREEKDLRDLLSLYRHTLHKA
jgi:hypothetical protein